MKGVTAVAFALLSNCIVLAQDTCGPIGNSDVRDPDERRMKRFYLNVANPAPCTGYVTSWRVCYYGPDDDIDAESRVQRSYWATYAVYRRMGNGRDERYVRVSEIFKAVRATTVPSSGDDNYLDADVVDGRIQQDDFMCFSDAVDNPPLLVQAGDFVGACVFRPEDGPQNSFSRRQLDVVGDSDSGSLLRMSASGCSIDAIPSSIYTYELSTVNHRRLHIYANIVGPEFEVTTPPDDEEDTTPSDIEETEDTTPPDDEEDTTPSDIEESEVTTHPEVEAPQATAIATTQSVAIVIKDSPSTTIAPRGLETTTVTATSVSLTLGTSTDGPTVSTLTTLQLGYSTSPNLQVVEDISIERGSSSGVLSPGAIAGVVIGLVLSLSLAVTVILAIVCLVRHRNSSAQSENVSTLTSEGLSFDNAVYDSGVNHMYAVPQHAMRRDHPRGSAAYHSTADLEIHEYATKGPNEEDFTSEHYSSLDEARISYGRIFEENNQQGIYEDLDGCDQPASEEEGLYAQLREYGEIYALKNQASL